MPDKWPLANGNWSNAANWNGGTKPVAGDDVFADNRTVTIDENVNVATIRTTQRSGGTAGGTFNLSDGVTVTCTTVTGGVISNANSICINYNGSSSSTINAVPLNSGGLAQTAILHSGTGTLNINGSFNTQVGGGSNVFQIRKSGTGTLNIVGNGRAGLGGNNTALSIDNAGTVNITGDLNNGGFGANTVNITSNCTVNITGTITSTNTLSNNPTPTIALTTAATVNITGNLIPTNQFCFSSTHAHNLTITGNVGANIGMPSVNSTNASATNIMNGNIINNNGTMAIWAVRVFLGNTGPQYWDFTTSNLLVNRRIYTADTLLGVPVASNVRSGTTYGAGSSLTGTLIMATPSNVRMGVPTDNTVGTAQLTAQDILTEIATSSDPTAVRLRNVSTVQISGDQIAAASTL